MKEIKNKILEAFEYRESTKEFLESKKISEDDFDFIMETGRLSPSSFGWEPWQFLVIQNPEVRAALLPYAWGAQKQLPTASHFVVILGRKASEMKVGSDYFKFISKEVAQLPEDIEQIRYDVFHKFQNQDFDLTDDRKIFDWVGKQTYIALGNMMTAAAQIGVDSCPMEGFDKDQVEVVLKEAGVLDTDHFGVTAMVAFGYRKASLDWPKTRRSKEQVVTWVR